MADKNPYPPPEGSAPPPPPEYSAPPPPYNNPGQGGAYGGPPIAYPGQMQYHPVPESVCILKISLSTSRCANHPVQGSACLLAWTYVLCVVTSLANHIGDYL